LGRFDARAKATEQQRFSAGPADGKTLRARRLILSYGIVDQMPSIPSFAESWGTSIVPCPYCDGFEVAGQHWGLVWSGPQSQNQVRLFQHWTDTLTVFANGHDIAPDVRADLAGRTTSVVDGRIVEIIQRGERKATVRLDTAPSVDVDILFSHPRNQPSAGLHVSLGLATLATPTGLILKVDERRETNVPGIYAAGDLTNPALPSVTTAVSQRRHSRHLRPAVDADLKAL
jgi:thioredoxin reductase